MKYQQHVIIGSGLIGCYLGAAMSRTAPVTFIGREVWLKRLHEGFTVSDYTGRSQSFIAEPNRCLSKVSERLDNACIWLTVKNTALESTIDALKPFIGKNCLVICCQNGIGAAQRVQKLIPEHQVIQGIVGFNVVWQQSAFQLNKSTEGKLYLELPVDSEEGQHLLSVFNTSKSIDCECIADIEPLAWAKLQLNLANSINALSNQPIKEMLLDKDCRDIIAFAMRELLAVAGAKAIKLPKLTAVPAYWLPGLLRLPTWLFKRLASKMIAIDESARSSMWWDIQAGKQTEICYLNQVVVEEGSKVGVKTPVNDQIVQLIRDIEVQRNVGDRPTQNGKSLKLKLKLK